MRVMPHVHKREIITPAVIGYVVNMYIYRAASTRTLPFQRSNVKQAKASQNSAGLGYAICASGEPPLSY